MGTTEYKHTVSGTTDALLSVQRRVVGAYSTNNSDANMNCGRTPGFGFYTIHFIAAEFDVADFGLPAGWQSRLVSVSAEAFIIAATSSPTVGVKVVPLAGTSQAAFAASALYAAILSPDILESETVDEAPFQFVADLGATGRAAVIAAESIFGGQFNVAYTNEPEEPTTKKYGTVARAGGIEITIEVADAFVSRADQMAGGMRRELIGGMNHL